MRFFLMCLCACGLWLTLTGTMGWSYPVTMAGVFLISVVATRVETRLERR